VEISSHILHQWPRTSFTDAEKTYSGLTDACAAAGRAGCKLVELTGDNASGDDVKALLNYAHDVVSSVSRLGNPTHPVYILGGPPALS
jgi:hypothetical protein